MAGAKGDRSEEHTSELQSLRQLVWRLLLEKNQFWISAAQADFGEARGHLGDGPAAGVARRGVRWSSTVSTWRCLPRSCSRCSLFVTTGRRRHFPPPPGRRPSRI